MASSSDSYQSRLQPLLTLLDLPWSKRAKLVGNIKETQARMDAKHAGLDKVKDVISEQIAVQMRTGNGNGKILCLDGPPGIGKTSLAHTIAYATGRPIVRFALGGVHDSHEIRGHRSTYVNATPGRIVSAMIEAGVKNPIILLDEIDKVGHTSKNASDMEAALLEVLDPEQNSTFKDTFIDTEIDLSEVLFIATSNDKSQIMPALLNRMEVVDLPAYTSAQKLDIALKHLLPKQMVKNGVSENNLAISSDAIKLMIDKYVREPGVRELERTIEKICRKAALQLESGSTPRVIVHDGNLSDFLGKAHSSSRVLTRENAVGVVNGLGVAGNTGSVLPFEVIKMPSNGRFSIQRTGQMRDMMKESVDIISSWIRANSEKHGIKPDDLNKLELHVNAIGSMPKDGPSAGTAITSACLSALTGRALRADVAMTGEMTLGGRVRAIGGTLAKLEGAMKDGMTTVLIPKANVDDLSEASDEIRHKLKIIPVETIDEVLEHVFVGKSQLQLVWDDADARDATPREPATAGPTKPLLLPAPTPAAP
jgi:ATP-dependent Lon protease